MIKYSGFLFAIVFLLPLLSFSQSSDKNAFEVSGMIRGLQNDSVVLMSARFAADGQLNAFDTVITRAKDGRFTLKGRVSKPDLTQIQFGGMRSRNFAQLVLEPGKILIVGSIDSLNYVSVTGTPTNNDLTKAQWYFAPIYERRVALSQELRKLQEGTEKYKELATQLGKKNDSINQYKIHFMEAHPASSLSLGYLYVLQDNLPTSKVETIYNGLSQDLKESSTGQYIYSKLQANKLVAVGNKAPDFVSFNMEGKKVKLSDYKGKYVLLEFWASWCVPCRAQSPHLVQLYHEYKEKGFTILQYSVDVEKDEQKWRDAIKKDGLVWTQISQLTGPSEPVSVIYGVQPIPDNFLISPEGVILGRRLNPKQLKDFLVKTF